MMKHKYKIVGMTCMGCVQSVETALLDNTNIEKVSVDLKNEEVEVSMLKHMEVDELQHVLTLAGLHYTIGHIGSDIQHSAPEKVTTGTGVFYCPMNCEGEKTYTEPGDCPVCGMDLVEQASLTSTNAQFTCTMHPEVLRDEPGDCPICGMDLVEMEPKESNEQKTYNKLLYKFKIALIFTFPIFILAMGEMIPGNPINNWLSSISRTWIQFLLSIPVVFYAGWMFFERGWRSIKTWNLNMFTLIAIGTGVAWLFSVFGMIFPDVFPDQFKDSSGVVHVYFEAAAVILSLVLLGQLLEARAHNKTSGAIKELLQLSPNEAILLDEKGNEHKVPIHYIKIGNILRVKPGDRIPVDGKLTEGYTSIDESMITGEPIPISKKEGDNVSAGTINGNQSFLMKAEKVGSDTLLAQIIQMVNNASRSRAPIQQLADTISRYFVPTVIVISIITFFIWYAWGPDPALVFAFVNAIAVLIIACPCALGLATPMSVMVGVGKGAKSGILIKNAEALQNLDKIDVLIIDKTGTITEGKPSVNSMISIGKMDENTLSKIVGSINNLSEHPLAEATVQYAKSRDVELVTVTDFKTVSGKGVQAKYKDNMVFIGNSKMMDQSGITIEETIIKRVKTAQKQGKTVSYIAMDKEIIGFITISDAIKETSIRAIKALKNRGVSVIMLTGDNENTAAAVAKEIGLTEYKADCLPQDKLEFIEVLQKKGLKVAMAGDGINDAPALAKADVGIAMGTGTDVAIESAEVTLLTGDLYGIEKAIKLGNSVMKNIKQNLFFAFAYNVLGIPIAAGLLYPVFGVLLSPMIAAAAMSFSSFSVIANSLRLRSISLN